MKQLIGQVTRQQILLVLIMIIAFWVRLYKLDSPVADWHSWRQADTAAVARNFFQEGFTPLTPRGDNMSAVSKTGAPNLDRLRFVEFPLYDSLVFFTYRVVGHVDERLARLVNVFFSLGSLLFIYLITKKYLDRTTAFVAAAIFAVLPYSVFYSRVILPEPSLVFFCLGLFYFGGWWFETGGAINYWLAVIFGSLAFLNKPMAIFYLLPLLVFYTFQKGRHSPFSKKSLLLVILMIAPFLLWRLWIGQHPEGIPNSDWLFNSNGIRFRPAFWRWLLVERLGKEILSLTGTTLLIIGFLIKPKSHPEALLHLLLLSSFAYLAVFATGNVQHDYYQVLIIPILIIFVARGFVDLIRGPRDFIPRIWTIPVAFLFLGLMLVLSWNEVKGLYQINHYEIVAAGQEAQKLLPREAIVLAPYDGDTAFLYQINRPGFALIDLPIVDMINRFHVTHFISVNHDSKTNWVVRHFQVLEQTPSFVIVDLRKKNAAADIQDREPQ